MYSVSPQLLLPNCFLPQYVRTTTLRLLVNIYQNDLSRQDDPHCIRNGVKFFLSSSFSLAPSSLFGMVVVLVFFLLVLLISSPLLTPAAQKNNNLEYAHTNL